MYEQFGLLIDGQWRASRTGQTRPVIDPVDENVIGHLPSAGAADLNDVLTVLAREAPRWAKVSGWERSVFLRRIATEMRALSEDAVRDMSAETGKPIAEAAGEWNAAIDQFDWFADESRRIFGHVLDGRHPDVRLNVRFDPVGPVAAFTAWNFPALLPARKIAASLAAGCPVVIKPSEEAPSSTFHIAAAAIRAGLPDGVLNVVSGKSSEISAHLIASPVIRKVSLTGSVPVGKLILKQCADTVKKVSMELGGHAPVLVLEDADPVAAATACARAKFRNAGQVCISPSRFYVHESLYEPFARTMADIANGLRIGRGSDNGVEMGPMANARGRERIVGMVSDALTRGATLLAGGEIPVDRNRGFFYRPTVLGDVPDDALIMREEPFGPVAPIARFCEFDDAIKRANDVPFGLAGYVFSRSLEGANKAAEALEVGMVGVNDMLLAAAEIPFGGIKESGMGREGGQLGIFDYLEAKYIKTRVV
ncbi:NAD-dependent succinate-semialdehyde dehydrogenase [Ensifer adhaerens]|uniref:NAD-dependent succinate-semialdehyde dehydrogenase n=1 Tax=Ensifer adhaerens TaxID=106592 RepID=UPI001CC0949D|nr:NAD-dependent succinate-semialdehyde dehydrogenase [Ensifer adhaerens]MBZ7924843.1 NAD-dependent succinate-semialdehyde dehydrogenase [Ensifer adhaerens]UAX95939.1 NAD-dependent succinate-semialdehyde dehydrogenase [Ensifer adhaerens]UAY04719.1 NAD-dependent succinate-semialdehyde dehydrogenase [Ensifer adhaerens]UAY10150.1 NAD-dependent succinate-semialdehyde dehydrogenase [Ensifer adhaerens]